MTDEPVRLLESLDLPESERALLEAGRAIAPTHYDLAAGAARFVASLDGLAVGGAAAAKGATGIGAATKLIAIVLLPTLGAGLAYYAWSSQSSTPQVRVNSVVVAAPARNAAPVTKPPPTAAAVEPSVVPTVVSSKDNAADVVAAPASERTRTRDGATKSAHTTKRGATEIGTGETEAARAPAPTPTPTTPGESTSDEKSDRAEASTVTQPPKPVAAEAHEPEPTQAAQPVVEPIDELHGIVRARSLLRSDPDAAIVLLDRIAREHPKGYFVEERSALSVLALSAAGKDELAEQRGKAFLRAYPSSPYADRVRDALSR